MIMEFTFTSHCSVLKLPRTSRLTSNNSFIHHRTVAANSSRKDLARNHGSLQANLTNNFKSISKFNSYHRWNRGVIVCVKSNENEKSSSGENSDNLNISMIGGAEPFRGKSGSVSFHGLTHQMVEESKLVSSPFKDINATSLLWIMAPIAFISSLVLPQVFVGSVIDSFFKDEILAELVTSISTEVAFYMGLAIYLFTTHTIQKPYLQFSPKRWGLITGLKGYMSSVFFIMGVKVLAPLLVMYVTWPVLGLSALIACGPFLAGCLVQYLFEEFLTKQESSCWPLITIIFEVYRLYQLSKAAHFVETLMFMMKDTKVTPEVLERNGALISLVVTFQILGIFCLWSFLTFLMRLFPSRPVAENY
ncbi:uncharacterized protein LOC124911470 [Impatiens glandulifera]|uniref:uncharacterized protein LOC124911470 n=1 Tax=Impatiens glandulifera TaxID=253017 RepID=UPI001FB1961E|nr:uncharacterized protein LOC124911470 [Impatiens glandulifera]